MASNDNEESVASRMRRPAGIMCGGEVADEENILFVCAEKVGSKEQLKVWAWENMNCPSRIFKEGDAGVLVDTLMDYQVDVPKGRPGRLRGHTEHGSDIPWEIVAVGRVTTRCRLREEWL